MELFTYRKASSIFEAISAASLETRYIAGGTTLFDLMKLNVERPSLVIDINGLPLKNIERQSLGGLLIGSLVSNADLAHHRSVVSDYPVLSQALLAGASAQLRNMATTGGNLLQRTRCMYFRNDAMACNKRVPDSGCAALEGENRSLAILGTSKHCIATNPSDMNVALTALEAVIHLEGTKGKREVSIEDFFLLPHNTPWRENVLQPKELVLAIGLPPPRKKSSQIYLKLRDRASYEFALSSAAIVAEIDENKFTFIRIALGGVGTKPWRSYEAEELLLNEMLCEKILHQAAEAALSKAEGQGKNGFKIELSKRCLIKALKLATKVG